MKIGKIQYIRVWDVATGKQLRSGLDALGSDTPAFSLSSDGRTIARTPGPFGSGRITLRETATGRLRTLMDGHHSDIYGVAFSPDGRTLASAGRDGTVRLWDVLAGQPICRFEGRLADPHRRVLAVAFSPDGRTLVSGGLDKKAHIWNVSRITGRRRVLKKRSAAELDADWRKLRGNAKTAYAALRRLVLSSDNAVAFLEKQLRNKTKLDTKRIKRDIGNLDHKQFQIRERATKELAALHELAAPALRKALADNPSLEATRRLAMLLARLDGLTIRRTRAVEALEFIGNPEARRLLKKLAAGPAEIRLTQEAEAAAARLAKRASVGP